MKANMATITVNQSSVGEAQSQAVIAGALSCAD